MFKEINWNELELNPSALFGTQWMALAAGNEADGCNAMTVAWGHLGAIWNAEGAHTAMPTAICYVRPQRYTKEFMDREGLFTLSRVPKKAHGVLGGKSGRDLDKIAAAGLTPVYADGTVYFEEADLVLICRKLYHAPLLEEGFVDRSIIERDYPQRDFHEMYVGEILKTLVKAG